MSLQAPAVQSSVLDMAGVDRLLLWAIRTWSAYHDEPAAVHSSLERAFVEAGLQSGLQPFEQLMRRLFLGWKRWPDIRCVRCLRLGRDEGDLLRLLYLLQQEQPESAVMLIRRMVSSAAMPGVQLAATELVRALCTASLFVSPSATQSTLTRHH
jgi:hypothetical protein